MRPDDHSAGKPAAWVSQQRCISLVCMLVVLGGAALAIASPDVVAVRHFSAPGYTRIVLDMSEASKFEVRRVANPERIAVNIAGARFASRNRIEIGDGLVKGIRRNASARRAQAVIDLETQTRFNSFALTAAAGRPHRIVIDILRPTTPPREKTPPATTAHATREPAPRAGRPFTVVIDPGHGGLDPGAIRDGVQEKDIVLDVSREIARKLNALPGYRAVLTRSSDYYPSLARRVEIAGEKDGDIFLSIHCNTHPKSSMSGMFVYFLSLQGATDREAQELADKENAADLVGLDPGKKHNDSVMSILMDLRMTQVLHKSNRLAAQLLAAAESSGVVRGKRVKQARFQVLRSLAMPSALVELAYLSNAQERKLLSSTHGRKQLAAIVCDGILRYRSDHGAIAAMTPTERWTRRYEVRRGDSLWKLARRHGTTIAAISKENGLRESSLRVGQWLRLPEAGGGP